MKLTNAFIKIYYKSNHLTTLNLKNSIKQVNYIRYRKFTETNVK